MGEWTYPGIPEHIMLGIRRWVEFGLKPGSFLQAVVSGDLFKAVSYADDESLEALKPIVMFFYNRLPSACWGPTALETWPREAKKRNIYRTDD